MKPHLPLFRHPGLASRAGLATLAAALLAVMASAPCRAETRTPDRTCKPGHPSLSVTVTGFSGTTGKVRAQLYGPGGEHFLDKGAWSMRIERQREEAGPMHFCFPIDQPGRYAVAIRHDANVNGKSDWNDGGGFTGNPRLSLFHLKPDFDKAAVEVGSQPVQAKIIMQYRRGLSIGPIAP
ncbi:MAG TPA: DUF2141 domain-containing protein [Novosphingobium capsulatum]|nr:DUF2141 domain-containing protein [Novosphingobium capsulatum]